MYCSRCGTWVPEDATACARCGMTRAGEPAAAAAPATPGPVPAAAAPPAVRYGGFWRRFAAAFVDGLILYFPNAILRVLAGLPPPQSLRPLQDEDIGRSLGLMAITLVIYWWYCGRLESSRWQGTLGQQLLGLRVTDLRGRRITFLRATGRYFAQYLSVLLCGLGYLFNLWTSRRQTLHDLLAGCVLVRPSAAPNPLPEPPAPSYAQQTP